MKGNFYGKYMKNNLVILFLFGIMSLASFLEKLLSVKGVRL
jgi:hypothetical protein